MFRLFEHLLPRAKAWRLTIEKTLRRYFEGLAGFTSEIRAFVDQVFLDLWPSSTRELEDWEDQFALVATGDEATRRLRLAAAWAALGGQSPDYIQSQLHAAGFTTVFIHEWWSSGPPFVARDPREYTSEPLLGVYQCEGVDPWECFDPGPGESLAPHCDASLANEPGYIVNLDLTRRAPPGIPSSPSAWPYFLYFGGATFGTPALVPADRIAELKAKILQLRPTQHWIVLMLTTIAIQSSGNAQSANGSTGFSTPVALAAGSSRLLLVATLCENTSAPGASVVTAVTYNGVPLDVVSDGTNLADLNTLPDSDDFANVKWWILREADMPANGTHNLTTTVAAGREHGVFWYVLTGAAQGENVRSVAMGYAASATSVSTSGLRATMGEFVAAAAYKNTQGATSPTQLIDGQAATVLAVQDHDEGDAQMRVFSSNSANEANGGSVPCVASSAASLRRGLVAVTISRAL